MMVSYRGHNVFSIFNDEKKLISLLEFIIEKLVQQEYKELETKEVIKNSAFARRFY